MAEVVRCTPDLFLSDPPTFSLRAQYPSDQPPPPRQRRAFFVFGKIGSGFLLKESLDISFFDFLARLEFRLANFVCLVSSNRIKSNVSRSPLVKET